MLVALAGLAAPLPATGLLIGAGVLLVGAVWLDGRSRDRLMPLDAFRPVSVVGTGLWMVLLINVAGAGSAVYLVLVVQQMWGYGPTMAGALAAVLAVAWSISAIAVANVRSKETRKTLIRLGPAMIGLGPGAGAGRAAAGPGGDRGGGTARSSERALAPATAISTSP